MSPVAGWTWQRSDLSQWLCCMKISPITIGNLIRENRQLVGDEPVEFEK